MGRNVKVRVSYQADALYFTRLKIAVDRDKRLDEKEKTKIIVLLNSLSSCFLDIESSIISGKRSAKAKPLTKSITKGKGESSKED